MNSDVGFAIALFLGLLAFYWWHEPKAKKQDPGLWQHWPQHRK